MQRHFLVLVAAVFALVLLMGCAGRNTLSRDISVGQTVVDAAVETVQKNLQGDRGRRVGALLSQAKGVMIIPSMGNISFMFSLGGGNAVALARNGLGWSGPVFLSKGTGGFGVQAGVTNTSGLVIYMNEKDFRYVLDTGALMQGQASITFLDKEYEGNRTPEFIRSGDVFFVGETSGLYAGVGINGGGLDNRESLNRGYHDVVDGAPENILYSLKSVPSGARTLVDLLDEAVKAAGNDKEKKKDGTEVPSY